MNQSSILQLTRGAITNHDEITVILIEPTDGTPALVRVQWPPRITTAAAAHYPAVAAAIVRIIAESATELAGIKGSPTAIDAHEKSPGESPGLLPFPASRQALDWARATRPKIERDARPRPCLHRRRRPRSSIA